MSTNYPGAIDNFADPQPNDSRAAVSLSGKITDLNDAIEAIETELGTDPAGTQATVKARLEAIDSSISAVNGKIIRSQIFTSSGTFNVPAGVTRVRVRVIGGGGGGGGKDTSNAGYSPGGGGGGGGYSEKICTVTPGGSETVTVGTGGAGGASGSGSAAAGSAGGTSSFGAHCQATGGAGGSAGSIGTPSSASNAVAGGVGSGGDINTDGDDGEGGKLHYNAASGGNYSPVGGEGGGTVLGGRSREITAGAAYGGGGGGRGGSGNAGAGADGVVIVEWFA